MAFCNVIYLLIFLLFFWNFSYSSTPSFYLVKAGIGKKRRGLPEEVFVLEDDLLVLGDEEPPGRPQDPDHRRSNHGVLRLLGDRQVVLIQPGA